VGKTLEFLVEPAQSKKEKKRKGLHNSLSENFSIVSGYDLTQKPMTKKHIPGIVHEILLQHLPKV